MARIHQVWNCYRRIPYKSSKNNPNRIREHIRLMIRLIRLIRLPSTLNIHIVYRRSRNDSIDIHARGKGRFIDCNRADAVFG